LIFRNGNVKSLFDPSNTEVNTVEDNMDKEVNYRGEVLLAPFENAKCNVISLDIKLLKVSCWYHLIAHKLWKIYH
jgi:hypothetical protein